MTARVTATRRRDVPAVKTTLRLSHKAAEAFAILTERHERSQSWIAEKLLLAEVKACRLSALRAPGDGTKTAKVGTPLSRLSAVWDEHHGNLPSRRRGGVGQKLAARNRLAESPDLGVWVEVVERLAASRRCNGANPTGWKASFDFLLLPETRAQVLEGQFDDVTIDTGKFPLKRDPGRYDAQPARRPLSKPVPPAPIVVDTANGAADVARLVGNLQEGSAPTPTACGVEPSPKAPVQEAVIPPPQPAPPPVVRTFEDPNAPAWIVELVDRIAADAATEQEIDVYRRWTRGEDVELPAGEP